jgi:HEAT repeat protein
MRFEDAAALQGVSGEDVKRALLVAAKDTNPRVRARAIQALGARKDQGLAATFQQALSDESYAVTRAAAEALGRTKNESGYDSLMKLLDTSSWRDNIRIAGLNGLAALGDPRSLAGALKYAASGNSPQVRAAAIVVLGVTGKDDPRVFPLLAEALVKSASPFNATLFSASGRALVELGDPRGVDVLEQAGKKLSSPRAIFLLQQLQQQLKQKSQPATTKTPSD